MNLMKIICLLANHALRFVDELTSACSYVGKTYSAPYKKYRKVDSCSGQMQNLNVLLDNFILIGVDKIMNRSAFVCDCIITSRTMARINFGKNFD